MFVCVCARACLLSVSVLPPSLLSTPHLPPSLFGASLAWMSTCARRCVSLTNTHTHTDEIHEEAERALLQTLEDNTQGNKGVQFNVSLVQVLIQVVQALQIRVLLLEEDKIRQKGSACLALQGISTSVAAACCSRAPCWTPNRKKGGKNCWEARAGGAERSCALWG